MSEPLILLVTSAGAPASAVVPVLAAIEAAGLRVRAIDLGGVGGGGSGMADRVRRALLGEGAERRLRKELEVSPPDAAVVFDPYAALALTVARDAVAQPAPVIAVVDELEPAAAWGHTDADRFVAVDELAAVALADAGVEADRILVVGAIGERAFAEAGSQDRAALRTRFKLAGRVALVEVAGLGGELTGALAMQLSLIEGPITFLFDAAGDPDAAAVLRRQVPALGLRAKLFGATADAALLWRAADAIVARPKPETIARVMLVGGKLVALVDDTVARAAKHAAALEARKRAVAASGMLMLSSSLASAFGGTPPVPTADGADHIADIVAVVAADRRGIIDERRAAAHAETRDRVRAATVATSAAAATSAMPGELEDLGTVTPTADVELPDANEIARLRAEVEQRKGELTHSMTAARDASTKLHAEAIAARAAGAEADASALDRRADAERARMHQALAALAALETELAALEKLRASIPKSQARRGAAPAPGAASGPGLPPESRPAPPRSSVDDDLASLKRSAGAAAPGPTRPAARATPSAAQKPAVSGGIDDELAALKRKMAAAPPKKP